MEDEVFVIGEHEPEETEPPPPRRWWLLLLVVGLVGAVAVATRPESDPEVTTPTLPSSVTQIEVPRAATVVDQTLEWEQADGFEGLVSLGGVVEFDGAWWAVGSDDDGLAAWSNQSESPAGPWELASHFGDNPARLVVVSVAVAGDELVVVAASTGFSTGTMFTSPDGIQWTERTLPTMGEDGSRMVPIKVIATDAGPIVYGATAGAAASEKVEDSLPDEWSRLVADGLVAVQRGSSAVTVWVYPGLEVARFTTEELGLEPAPEPTDNFWVAWHGPDLGDLEATTMDDDVYPWFVEVSDSGTVFAMVGNRVSTSQDGLEWDRSSTRGLAGSPALEFVPWMEGVVIIGSPGYDLIFWDPSNEERENLPVPDMGGSEVALRTPVADAVGLALIAVETDRNDVDPQPTLMTTQGDRQLFYLAYGHVQYVEGGVEVARQPLDQGTFELDTEERELVFDNDGAEFIRVSIGDWLDGVDRASRQPQLGENPRILHTRDGSVWSVEQWDEITGLEQPGLGFPFAAGEYLLAVAVGDSVAAEGVWVARPVE